MCISGCVYLTMPYLKGLYRMIPYFCESTNVPNDPNFEHCRGIPFRVPPRVQTTSRMIIYPHNDNYRDICTSEHINKGTHTVR